MLMQCAVERKYYAGVLRELRGRAATQLRENVDADTAEGSGIDYMHSLNLI